MSNFIIGKRGKTYWTRSFSFPLCEDNEEFIEWVQGVAKVKAITIDATQSKLLNWINPHYFSMMWNFVDPNDELWMKMKWQSYIVKDTDYYDFGDSAGWWYYSSSNAEEYDNLYGEEKALLSSHHITKFNLLIEETYSD